MKSITERAAEFKLTVQSFKSTYQQSILDEFYDYWTEPNKSNTKMKFELEKTWETSRRLSRWANNGFGEKGNGNHAPKKEAYKAPKMLPAPQNDFEVLDRFLSEYISRPSGVPFEAFGKWYDFMKENKLLRPFTKPEVDMLIEVYGGDKEKCRCAVVQKTFDGYVNTGFRIMDIFKVRERV